MFRNATLCSRWPKATLKGDGEREVANVIPNEDKQRHTSGHDYRPNLKTRILPDAMYKYSCPFGKLVRGR